MANYTRSSIYFKKYSLSLQKDETTPTIFYIWNWGFFSPDWITLINNQPWAISDPIFSFPRKKCNSFSCLRSGKSPLILAWFVDYRDLAIPSFSPHASFKNQLKMSLKIICLNQQKKYIFVPSVEINNANLTLAFFYLWKSAILNVNDLSTALRHNIIIVTSPSVCSFNNNKKKYKKKTNLSLWSF